MESKKYIVTIRAVDGTHELTKRPVSYKTAKKKADAWLGDCHSGWQGRFRCVSMYGEVVTISEVI